MTEQSTFYSYFKPPLSGGTYRVNVTRTLHEASGTPITSNFSKSAEILVAGERFAFSPELIHAVYPPADSRADYTNVIPHVVLNRTTLPWEKPITVGGKQIPWLMLILLHGEEAKEFLVDSAPIHEIAPELGDTTNQTVTLLKIKKSLLSEILPKPEQTALLAYVRENEGEPGKSILLANRIPHKGAVNTAFLVSLEGLINNEAWKFPDLNGNEFAGWTRLVCLKSWRFSSTDHYRITEAGLQKVEEALRPIVSQRLHEMVGEDFSQWEELIAAFNEPGELVLTNEETKRVQEHFQYGHFETIAKNLDRSPSMLREEASENSALAPYTLGGFTALPHYLFGGKKTISWFHGPLLPAESTLLVTSGEPAGSSNDLLRFDTQSGMFDVSFASAWELGRLMALQNQSFSTQLYQWKRAKRHAEAAQKGSQFSTDIVEIPRINQEAVNWLSDLSWLEGIPFNYLVTKETMLPTESIRFFVLDRNWLRALLDGAFSIGRVSKQDLKRDKDLLASVMDLSASFDENGWPVSGCLVRSELISGWPDLRISGIAEGIPIEPKKLKRLSANTMLVLFHKTIDAIEFHLKPEKLHFALPQGTDQSKALKVTSTNPDEPSVLNLAELPALFGISNQDSAKFAVKMLTKGKKISFLRGVTPPAKPHLIFKAGMLTATLNESRIDPVTYLWSSTKGSNSPQLETSTEPQMSWNVASNEFGQRFNLQVKAQSGGKTSVFSGLNSVMMLAGVRQPSGRWQNGAFHFSWPAVEGAEGYNFTVNQISQACENPWWFDLTATNPLSGQNLSLNLIEKKMDPPVEISCDGANAAIEIERMVENNVFSIDVEVTAIADQGRSEGATSPRITFNLTPTIIAEWSFAKGKTMGEAVEKIAHFFVQTPVTELIETVIAAFGLAALKHRADLLELAYALKGIYLSDGYLSFSQTMGKNFAEFWNQDLQLALIEMYTTEQWESAAEAAHSGLGLDKVPYWLGQEWRCSCINAVLILRAFYNLKSLDDVPQIAKSLRIAGYPLVDRLLPPNGAAYVLGHIFKDQWNTEACTQLLQAYTL